MAAFRQNREATDMNITEIVKSYQAGIQKAGKASSGKDGKEWKLVMFVTVRKKGGEENRRQ